MSESILPHIRSKLEACFPPGRTAAQVATSEKSTNVSTPLPSPTSQKPVPAWMGGVPRTRWAARCHTRVDEMRREINQFFLVNWPIPSQKARKRFINSDFAGCICWNYCEALDDRIGFVCRLVTLLFLVDDVLEGMTLDEGRQYNESLMVLMHGNDQPNRDVPVEWIMYDLWEEMRLCDKPLADDVLEPTFEFMRAQTSPKRLMKMSLGEYLQYRIQDVGAEFLMALARFSMGLHLSEEDLELSAALERNFAYNLSIMNDVWSYDKEVKAAQELHQEGSVLCNAVAILSADAEISPASARKTLYFLLREWEIRHEELVEEMVAKKDMSELRRNALVMQYQMAGNEIWSMTTARYAGPSMSVETV